MKKSMMLLAVMVVFLFPLAGTLQSAAERPPESKETQVEIQGPQETQENQWLPGTIPPEPVVVPEPTVPVIPKPITDTDLNAAEKFKIDQLEREYSEGKITKTDYELQKDAIFREANITF